MRVLLTLVALCFAALPAWAQGAQGKTEVLWLGQAAFRITSPGGKVVVIDPYILQNPKTPQEWKDLGKLGKVDAILVTHAHVDHFGDSIALARQNKVPVWLPSGFSDTLVDLGLATAEEVPRMNKGGTITPAGPGIAISMVNADHSSDFVYVNPETKKREARYAGTPVGFIVKLENGFTIYHMGDTNLFGDMALIGRIYKPDLLLVPIGGHFVMDPKLAAEATKMVKPKIAIPMHYGTFPMLRGTPEEYIKALGKTATKVMVMQPGQSLTFDKGKSG
jgi:L-ascorbate metabolism protein UlaG (beta-lactamase superfamily)